MTQCRFRGIFLVRHKRHHTSPSTSTNLANLYLKRSKLNCTRFEQLPNELLIEIFIYQINIDILYSFSKLNSRFQSLLLNYHDRFDFKSVTKTKMNYISHEHITEQCRSLRLSDDEQTPGQIAYFFHKLPCERYISQLEVLSLIHMDPNYTQILSLKLNQLTNLVSLTLGNICGKQMVPLNLPFLRNLVVTTCHHNKWMQNLHELKILEYNIKLRCLHENDLIWPITLEELKIYFAELRDNEIVKKSLPHVSQLKSLAFYDNSDSSSYPDGHAWETFISSFLPLLTKFQFCFKFWNDNILIQNPNQIISTFSTPFYIKMKQWFVQYDMHSKQHQIAVLYSLPFAFERFELHTDSFDQSKTTSITNKNLFRKVTTLVCNTQCEKLNSNLVHKNIQHIILKTSGVLVDWLFSMNYTRQLSICSQTDLSSKDFYHLIETMSCLDSLNIPFTILVNLTDHWKNDLICNQLSLKIRSLNLCYNEDHSSPIPDYVNREQFLQFFDIFHMKCEHLTIGLFSKEMITDLILPHMINLQSLHIYLKKSSSSINTNNWLQEKNIINNIYFSVTLIDDECVIHTDYQN
ncbi:hypothetical protein I4U23_028437 [Adineta vaga]|nr:hypothetical protein I4U23_028437 [Adineta vaga]